MRTVGLLEAKQKLSELVERAREGENIGITRRGELAAVLVPDFVSAFSHRLKPPSRDGGFNHA
jgi:prevent-host-death family protein